MKLTHSAKLLTLGLILSLAATGCHKKQQYVTPIPGSRTGGPENVTPGSAIPGSGTGTGENVGTKETGFPINPELANWVEHPDILEAQTVYFDLDSSTIKTAEKGKVAAVADYLKANSGNGVRVQGHCDERGTEEYNRSLGERRALALREELIGLGCESSRLDTISFGKDHPADAGHDESAWKKNRRG